MDGLKRHGKTLDNPAREVTVTFITHCPDPELSLVFSCKPLEEWTATDVQVRLDEHHRKWRLEQLQSAGPADCLQPAQAEEVIRSHVQTTDSPYSLLPHTAGRPFPNESQSFEHVIPLLERLLHRESSQSSRPPRSGTGRLKLAPKKCHFMRPSVKFFGHVVRKDGIYTDHEKVKAIVDLDEKDLIEEGTDTPSPSKIRSFLSMVGFYQQFFEGYSRISKPLFALTSGVRRPRHAKNKRSPPVIRRFSSADLTPECNEAFKKLKQALLDNATLAHPNFGKPFLLSVDASSNGLGAVLSQVVEGEDVAQPIAFASIRSTMPSHAIQLTGWYSSHSSGLFVTNSATS